SWRDEGVAGTGSASASACTAGVPENSSSCLVGPISFGIQYAHFRFDPVLHLLVDGIRAQACGIDQRTDRDRDQARLLDEGLATPAFPCIVGHGNNGGVGTCGQQSSAHFVATGFPGCDACAFGEQYRPTTFVNTLLSGAYNLLEGITAFGAVDGHHA